MRKSFIVLCVLLLGSANPSLATDPSSAGSLTGYALSCEALFKSGEITAHPSVRYEALDADTTEGAIKLVQRNFSYEAGTDDFFEIHPHLMEVAAHRGELRGLPGYWVAVEVASNHVIGTIGLYESDSYGEHGVWVDWYTVNTRSRGMGIGKTLLQVAIAHARTIGLSEIKLYTSNRQAEAAAQIVYEKMGFFEYRRIPQLDEETAEQVIDIDGKTPVEIIFRRLVID